MDDLASKLGISKKTIYLFFRNKEELVRTFTEAELREMENDMFDIRKSSGDSVSEILQLMTYLGNFFNKVNPSVFYDLQKYHPESWNAFTLFREKCLINFVEDNLKKGIQQNFYRKELKIKILARLRIEEIEMGFNPGIYPHDKFKLTDVQLTLLDHFLHGIVTMKGYRLIEKYKLKNKN
jgi:AcrR family transcriptional regulator